MNEKGIAESLRYPVGKFVKPNGVLPADRAGFLERIRTTPSRLAGLVKSLSDGQIDTPYREGGWTVRQVVHHVPDSHMQAYSRTKMALTENDPVIKPYREGDWAKLPDTAGVPLESSLCLLDCLHKRWVAVLESLSEDQWKRTYVHPEMGAVSLETMAALYAWHGDHHIGHIRIVAGK